MFVPILLIISATSCTDVTGKTCKKSKFVTGTCSNETCVCVNGYESARTGCIEKMKPSVEIVATEGGNPEQKDKGSGEVFLASTITLLCLPRRSNVTYTWLTSFDEYQTNLAHYDLPISQIQFNQSVQYRCNIKQASSDYVSEFSDNVTITVITGKGGASITPVATPLYKRAMRGATFSFTCTNLPSGVTLGYMWFVNDVQTQITTQTYGLIMTNETLSKNVTCKVLPSDSSDNITFTSYKSTAVTAPSSFTDDITGVYIEEAVGGGPISVEPGLELSLHCRILDTDLAIDPTTLAYTWTKNEVAIEPKSDTFNVTASDTHSGVYKCRVQVGTRPVKESAGLTVIVAEVMGSVVIVTDPPDATPLLGGFMSMQCNPEVKNLSKVTYKWYKDDLLIYGQTDNLIQINGVRADDSAKYQCQATVDSVRNMSRPLSVPAPVTPSTTAPQTPTSDKPAGDNFGVGNKYTLTCGNTYETPGMTYQWKKGAENVQGQTTKIYNITAATGAVQYSCLVIFNGISSKESPSITVEGKAMTRITILLADTTVSAQTIKPLIDAEVTLECNVTKAAGGTGEVTYAWLKGDATVPSQTSSKYRFKAGTGYDGLLRCRATIGSETMISEAVTVVSVSGLEAPDMKILNSDVTVSGQNVYVEGATYMMYCITSSHTSGVLYTWFKDQTPIFWVTTRSYTITSAKKGPGGDSGVYTCRATLMMSSVPSTKAITVFITDAGRPCNYVTDCLGPRYTPNCVNNRCECAAGLTVRGNTCTSGAASLTSLLLLVWGTVALRWT